MVKILSPKDPLNLTPNKNSWLRPENGGLIKRRKLLQEHVACFYTAHCTLLEL